MTKIFSEFHEAVTFLCYLSSVVAKESRYKKKKEGGSLTFEPPSFLFTIERFTIADCILRSAKRPIVNQL
jgi:hypothetical protein